jgi:predicted dehydrogenase
MHGRLVGAAKLELEYFFNCVLNDQPPSPSGEDGRRSLEVMLAAERSIAEGRIISLPL